MKNLGLIFLLFFAVGCESKKKITQGTAALITVSCCQDNNGGVMSYPSFVPIAHVQFCENIRPSKRDGDNLYFAMNVDCGRGYHAIGDEYYPSSGY